MQVESIYPNQPMIPIFIVPLDLQIRLELCKSGSINYTRKLDLTYAIVFKISPYLVFLIQTKRQGQSLARRSKQALQLDSSLRRRLFFPHRPLCFIWDAVVVWDYISLSYEQGWTVGPPLAMRECKAICAPFISYQQICKVYQQKFRFIDHKPVSLQKCYQTNSLVI